MSAGDKILWVVCLFIVGLFFSMVYMASKEGERHDIAYDNFKAEQKNIREMTSFLGTNGEISGGFLLIAGSIYGNIDTQHSITLVYDTRAGMTELSRTVSLPLNKVDIITIKKDAIPYFTVKEVDRYAFSVRDNNGPIESITLYLPEGWKILPRSSNDRQN